MHVPSGTQAWGVLITLVACGCVASVEISDRPGGRDNGALTGGTIEGVLR